MTSETNGSLDRQTFTKIGYKALQSNKHYVLFLCILFVGAFSSKAQEEKVVPLSVKAVQDTIVAPLFLAPLAKDNVGLDSVSNDSLNKKPPLLLDKITYKAKDYVRLSQKENKIYLYNEAEIYYQDTELKAGVIIMDYVKNEVYAGRLKDS